MPQKRQIHLSAYLVGTGIHVASWRLPEARKNASIDIEYYKYLAQTAERGKFDIAFIADSLAVNEDSHPNILNRFEPTTLLAALAGATSKIGLVATASTTYYEPYNLARLFASVDHISNGRAGWNMVTTGDATGETGRNFSRNNHLEHDHRYEWAEEFIDVVQGLWDSWEDDAFVQDKETGVFFDPNKLHRLHYKGTYYSVQGPLNIGRSRQGQPVIVQAGASEPGQRLAARTAEVVFSHVKDFERAKAFYRSLKSKLADYGRTPDQLHILQGISPIVADTKEEAEAIHRRLHDLLLPEQGLRFLSGYLGKVDFSKYSLDTPAKEVEFPQDNGIQSHFEWMTDLIRQKNPTLRELYALLEGGPNRELIGTPEQIADVLEKWFTQGAADGFMFIAPVLPQGLEAFVDKVIPLLQERGLYRHDYEGDTLREHLGLEKPYNRLAVRSRALSKVES
ncbi:LLM class flavin-dependent oxidoreductase [Brevibacillus sp. FSL K6-0770]|uniref:LLM class flavin-dependent oxidoreductase n=1 Tax=Brevibacillus TaxID=55080 RepID=UPI00156B39E2|nr:MULTISPECIES: LLM class flavin-dependent oxidoreductase [Brevibacillus]MBU8711096.1 NtaA/DmoA family FMN-dependent monooxygenase [Brevibacillus parabrevis]NRQ53903.1 LLM class flavin-dependent oxidoreductase [Brevibacillus sp. HD1.4A]